MDIRKVERRVIDVRNPDYTIKKAIRGPYSDETPEEFEARLLEEGDKCPICRGEGYIIQEQAVDVRFEGDGRGFPERCHACNGSGKYEDYLKWKDKQPKPKIKPDSEDDIERFREKIYHRDDDDWRKKRIIES